MTGADLPAAVQAFIDGNWDTSLTVREWWRRLAEAGYAFPAWPEGLGGLGVSAAAARAITGVLAANRVIGPPAGHLAATLAAPTLLEHGTAEQVRAFVRAIALGEAAWCQLFSEPGSGSDLASIGTRAVRDGDEWVVSGQKVWTSSAHVAKRALLVTRTDPDVPKHQGLTYFAADMTAPGVEVRPLRQITGEAEFNEVFLTDVRIPDADRIGAIGQGWQVSTATLMNERVSIGGGALPREGGMIGSAAQTWREQPALRTPGLHERLLRLWTEAEVARLAGIRLRQQLAAGQPGPEGSAAKLVFARLNQDITEFEVELAGADGLRYDDWSMRRPQSTNFYGRESGYRFLRSKGNSIEGGTSEILRNIVAERVLGLPPEIRVDKDVPWKDLPR